ncbi:DUF6119 family protein [Rhizobium sp. CCGE 510]|uniref:DUF6119 family protein n=1 Tax=Rhizobium sp. CCGE 510 TaxID=1132836 RepID=UPI00027B85A2|nr:DUF6119 family protein [Rhizobium sp. CCGE 510]EJT06821.1 hypothetical protein RCCGE510_03468 [Rhizobium sp. CCGE 510]
MSERIQKLSIRLLREQVEPADAVRAGVVITDWPKIEGSKIVLDTVGGGEPKWSKFLELSPEELAKLKNLSAMGVVFLKTAGRWFAVSFGMGHIKLDPAKFEQDFGLRVVLNSVDPKLLKSADVRTPDENTLSRRSQTSRGSDQTAFAIDVERDIVRGLAGKPKNANFATRVAGSDGLTMDRKLNIAELTTACADAYQMYQKIDYRTSFGWIDQIKHVREDKTLKALRALLVIKVDVSLKAKNPDGLHLAYPVIYDPEKGNQIQYKGFRSQLRFADLDITGYFEALMERGKSAFADGDLDSHSIHEVDEEGRDCGGKWPLLECLATEVEHDGHIFVLSGGRWYQIDKSLAKDVVEFFDKTPRVALPPAEAGENEEKYNERQKDSNPDLLCLDRKLIVPSGWNTTLEACDFLTKSKELIHVKDKTSSSRLSHLFNQGTVSGRVLILDAAARDKVRDKITDVETETGQSGFLNAMPAATEAFHASDFTVVYAVISTGKIAKLPFFSLLTFRQAARDLQVAGFKYAFAWIEKPEDAGEKKKRGDKKAAGVAAVLEAA